MNEQLAEAVLTILKAGGGVVWQFKPSPSAVYQSPRLASLVSGKVGCPELGIEYTRDVPGAVAEYLRIVTGGRSEK